MYSKIIVLSNTEISHLGLGEYLRIASFIPNIYYNELVWVGDEKINSLLKEVDHIDKFLFYSDQNFSNFIDQESLVINLTIKEFNFTCKTINILKYSKNEKDFKSKTKNLLQLIANELKIKEFKLFFNKKKFEGKHILICWKVPEIWKIKSYPMENWNLIVKDLKLKTNLKIIFQDPDEKLEYFIEKIKKSVLVVSVVSLSCHLAMLYNKKLIVLSGPNNFVDLNMYPKAKVLLPDNKCEFRPCNLFKGYEDKNCGCMPNINYKKVTSEIINELS